ncbi:unnamed protein product [Lota lota]
MLGSNILKWVITAPLLGISATSTITHNPLEALLSPHLRKRGRVDEAPTRGTLCGFQTLMSIPTCGLRVYLSVSFTGTWLTRPAEDRGVRSRPVDQHPGCCAEPASQHRISVSLPPMGPTPAPPQQPPPVIPCPPTWAPPAHRAGQVTPACLLQCQPTPSRSRPQLALPGEASHWGNASRSARLSGAAAAEGGGGGASR